MSKNPKNAVPSKGDRLKWQGAAVQRPSDTARSALTGRFLKEMRPDDQGSRTDRNNDRNLLVP